MALGPGKYDFEATMLRVKTKADGVVLIVLGGHKGNGMAVQMRADEHRAERITLLAKALRDVADQFEADAASVQS